jgi:hypothetical protein
MKHLTLALTSVVLIQAVACNTTDRTKTVPNTVENAVPVNAAPAQGTYGNAVINTSPLRAAQSAIETATNSDAVRTLLPPNPATIGASLGRSFQGEIVADISLPNKAQPAAFRYMASGDRMRMRLDGSPSDFDLIADGKSLAVLNHAKNSFRKFDLSELSNAPVQKPSNVDRKNDLDEKENEDAVTFQAGLRCEEHTIKGPNTEIQVCVAALPGEFERATFERATGIKVPAWLAKLVDNDEFPLRARGHYDNSGEFTATVTRYVPDPLPEATFIIPANYVQETK